MHEVGEALEMEERGLVVRSAMSEEYAKSMERRVQLFIDQGFESARECLEAAGISVRTIATECGRPEDEIMLIEHMRRKARVGLIRWTRQLCNFG